MCFETEMRFEIDFGKGLKLEFSLGYVGIWLGFGIGFGLSFGLEVELSFGFDLELCFVDFGLGFCVDFEF